MNTQNIWDHRGVAVRQVYSFDWVFGFKPNIVIAPIVVYEGGVLRPSDFYGLPNNHKYVQNEVGVSRKSIPETVVQHQDNPRWDDTDRRADWAITDYRR